MRYLPQKHYDFQARGHEPFGYKRPNLLRQLLDLPQRRVHLSQCANKNSHPRFDYSAVRYMPRINYSVERR